MEKGEQMTANQIAYWRNVETERSNLASEAIRWSQAESQQLTAEAAWHNAETNLLNYYVNVKDAESRRMQAYASQTQAYASTISAEGARVRGQAQLLSAETQADLAGWQKAKLAVGIGTDLISTGVKAYSTLQLGGTK